MALPWIVGDCALSFLRIQLNVIYCSQLFRYDMSETFSVDSRKLFVLIPHWFRFCFSCSLIITSSTHKILNMTLWLSVSVFSLQRVEEFIDAGCDVNCLDSERTRNTPLHWAASYSTPDILQMLIGMSSQYYLSISLLTDTSNPIRLQAIMVVTIAQ